MHRLFSNSQASNLEPPATCPLQDLAPLKTLQTPLQSITCSTYLPHSNLLALGSYTSSLLLLDPASGEQAGKLSDAASSAALSVTAWQEEGDVLMGGGEGREMVAVGDADGGVNLMQIVPDGHVSDAWQVS